MEVFLTFFGACLAVIVCLGITVRVMEAVGERFGGGWAAITTLLLLSFFGSAGMAILFN